MRDKACLISCGHHHHFFFEECMGRLRVQTEPGKVSARLPRLHRHTQRLHLADGSTLYSDRKRLTHNFLLLHRVHLIVARNIICLFAHVDVLEDEYGSYVFRQKVAIVLVLQGRSLFFATVLACH